MSQNRTTRQVLKARPTMEGAGVHLKRVFGLDEEPTFEPEYLDVAVPAGSEFTHRTKAGHTVFACVFDGQGDFGPGDDPDERAVLGNGHLVLFGDADQITVSTGDQPVRFLLIAGKPIGEPMACGIPS
jgi:redox-sensitive bicupin YhaK (pirin superfamily)